VRIDPVVRGQRVADSIKVSLQMAFVDKLFYADPCLLNIFM
jgi:hypothetical protein